MLKTFCWRQQNHISIVFSYVWKKYSKWQQLQKTINIPRKRKHKMDCRCGRDRHENIFIDQQNSTFHDAKDMSKALKCCLRKTSCHRRRWRRRRSGKFQLVFDAIHEHKKQRGKHWKFSSFYEGLLSGGIESSETRMQKRKIREELKKIHFLYAA